PDSSGATEAVMKLWRLVTITALGFLSFLARPATALNEPTHAIVNEHAGRRSRLDHVLKTELGLAKGIEHSVASRPVFAWRREGGIREDEGTLSDVALGRARFTRHFHDPLQSWDAAGFSFASRQYESSVRWMQRID